MSELKEQTQIVKKKYHSDFNFLLNVTISDKEQRLEDTFKAEFISDNIKEKHINELAYNGYKKYYIKSMEFDINQNYDLHPIIYQLRRIIYCVIEHINIRKVNNKYNYNQLFELIMKKIPFYIKRNNKLLCDYKDIVWFVETEFKLKELSEEEIIIQYNNSLYIADKYGQSKYYQSQIIDFSANKSLPAFEGNLFVIDEKSIEKNKAKEIIDDDLLKMFI